MATPKWEGEEGWCRGRRGGEMVGDPEMEWQARGGMEDDPEVGILKKWKNEKSNK